MRDGGRGAEDGSRVAQGPAPDAARAAVAGASARPGARASTGGLLPIGLMERGVRAAGARLAQDCLEEARSGRLILWLPVAFAIGILLYFGAEQEPSLLACGLLLPVFGAGAFLARARPFALGAMLVLLAMAAGFFTATWRTARLAHPVVDAPAQAVRLSGHVERVEHRVNGDRILLRLDGEPVRGLDPVPDLVRLTLRKGWAPPVGTHVTQFARLLPPLGPAMPGAYDFGRGPWFQGIGAVGYGLGRPKLAPAAREPPFSLRMAVAIDGVRQGLIARIRSVLSGVPAEIAVALVAGDRSAIPFQVEEGMRVSGLTHILSISGLHMAMVMGTLFFLVRAALAMIPALALGFPIKSMAAAVALFGGAGYLLLSGNEVPAQRSFVMAALVMLGVVVGRPALTLRTVAVAAVVVLALTPEAVLEPGTQMSFAATLALVAAYERLRPLRALPRPDGPVSRVLIFLAVLVGGTALTSLVAGGATAPFGAFHFQRLAPYGLLANVAAMPAVSFLVMPFGLLGVLLLPFGWDGLAWPVMGFGIEVMTAVSDHVAALPGADVRVGVMGVASIACASLALLILCLVRGALSFAAVVPLVAAFLVAPAPLRPDVLVAPNGQTVGVRGSDGRLSIIGARTHRLMAEQWLIREGDRRKADDPSLAAAFTCDALGCVAPLPGGGTIAVSQKAESLEADCLDARIVVTTDIPPGACPAGVLTPDQLARTGTLTLRLDGKSFRETPTRPETLDRPWMPRRAPPKQMEDTAADAVSLADEAAAD